MGKIQKAKNEAIMDWDGYNQAKKDRQEKNLQDSIAVIHEAKKLARSHNLVLEQHSQWHFSLTKYKNRKRQWRRNIYPSNQRIWWDEKCGKAKFLELPKPWNLLDIVKKSVEKSPKAV